jgi:hypothetical protein
MGNNVCMKRIEVDEVLDAVDRVLAVARGTGPSGETDPSFYTDQDGRPLGRVVRGGV